jgi:hypothetical protein
MIPKYYCGWHNNRWEAFSAENEPTAETHGDKYLYVIGPFRTKRAALFTEKEGHGPNMQTVDELERAAKDAEIHPHRIVIGNRYFTGHHVGLDSRKFGVAVPLAEVGTHNCGGNLIPNVRGAYYPLKKSEVVLRLDDGEYIILPKGDLINESAVLLGYYPREVMG